MNATNTPLNVLIIGASRGLGLAIVEQYLLRGDQVIATARSANSPGLLALQKDFPEQLRIELLDITHPQQVAALKKRLVNAEVTLDFLFVNAGVTNEPTQTIADVSTEDFNWVMLTNTLSPMRVIDALQDVVAENGSIGVMSSGQGSITNNSNGLRDVYRASKAALNMLMKGFVARHPLPTRTFFIMAPGWVKTDLGGEDARYTVKETIPKLVNTLELHRGETGLHYLDFQDQRVPW
ncbi:SDR family NAD(P)-dependent oxidoreductase [Pokkaliibacter sp. CJK22405]|uniref:SDR family NAD(P)-dependent oxidoreductase n=1 Tax=Pokkaliibacter sp. CJK22405 TaxID=3384615 RepID=UPI003984B856